MAIFCSKCGSTDVSCRAVVNPGTKAFIQYADESPDYGWCGTCRSGRVLADPERFVSDMKKAYLEYKAAYNEDPLYASCRIIFKDSDKAEEGAKFKLSHKVDGMDDGIFFYCCGVEGLKPLARPSGEDFTVTGFETFNH